MVAEGSDISVQKVELETLSPEVRTFLAQAVEGKGVLVEDRRTQERNCVVEFREPTPDEQRAEYNRSIAAGTV